MRLSLPAAILSLLSLPALADGDIEDGGKDFGKCKACHSILNGDEVIQKGGKVGPNLYGVIGRPAGSLDGYAYGASLVAAGEAGLIWDVETLIAYLADPKDFLRGYLNDATARSKMTFKLADGANVAAYLASIAPLPEAID